MPIAIGAKRDSALTDRCGALEAALRYGAASAPAPRPDAPKMPRLHFYLLRLGRTDRTDAFRTAMPRPTSGPTSVHPAKWTPIRKQQSHRGDESDDRPVLTPTCFAYGVRLHLLLLERPER